MPLENIKSPGSASSTGASGKSVELNKSIYENVNLWLLTVLSKVLRYAAGITRAVGCNEKHTYKSTILGILLMHARRRSYILIE